MNGEGTIQDRSRAEVRLRGMAVSRGVALGHATCLHGDLNQFFKTSITQEQLPTELQRLDEAFLRANDQLTLLSRDTSASDSRTGIFEAHLMVLADPSFRSRIEELISSEHINAEWAISSVAAGYVSRLKSLSDQHLRERYIDVADVAERLLSAFSKEKLAVNAFSKNSILAAEEIRPSTLVELESHLPIACVTEHGGWTSHTNILARDLGLPAVTGVKNLLRVLKTGDSLIVDGFNGLVIVNPTSETVELYRDRQAPAVTVSKPSSSLSSDEIQTLDGKNVELMVNAENPSHARKALSLGARGVGLFRSEALFNRFSGFPTEEEQFQAYRAIADEVAGSPVKIRTFDLSIGQTAVISTLREKNPALGLRGIRFALHEKVQLRFQLRALLRASAVSPIDIVLPMVDGVREIRAAKAVLDEVREEMVQDGLETGYPSIGAMIEIPAAVTCVEQILDEVDLICLGTNDLVQYMLAVDRDNESVADWFRSLHPAVISAISKVCDAAIASGKPLIVCGEMAGSPFYTPLLIGLGATVLSMNVHSLPAVANLVRNIAYEEAHDMTKSLAKMATPDEAESAVREFIRSHWSHLYPADFFSIR
jgi:phosphotransferase system enzyme I (PtsI)